MKISGKTKMCIIIGDPVEHSLSPAMHNAAYKALGIDDQFVFTAAHVKVEDIEHVVTAVRVMGIRGLTCTIPHKMEVLPYLDTIDPIAKKIGAVNTVVNENGVLTGYNTDWLGTITPLQQALSARNQNLDGKKVALIGAGGAARAMAYGVVTGGATISIFNRTLENATELANEVGGEAHSIDQLELVRCADIVINSTPMGMGEQIDNTPVPKKYISKNQIVFDAVYAPRETRLLREAAEQGAQCVYGWEMLLHQGTAQFELYTGHKAPVDVMKSVLLQ